MSHNNIQFTQLENQHFLIDIVATAITRRLSHNNIIRIIQENEMDFYMLLNNNIFHYARARTDMMKIGETQFT